VILALKRRAGIDVKALRPLPPAVPSAGLQRGGIEGHRPGGGGTAAGLAPAPSEEHPRYGKDGDEPDDTEGDRAEGGGDAGGGDEPEDGTGAAGGAGGSADAEHAEAGFGGGGVHVGQRAAPKRAVSTG